MKCTCKFDANGSQVVLDIPDGLIVHRKIRKVSVDKCISKVVLWLWENKIETLSCCCGHNGQKGNPSLVIAEGYKKEDYIKIRKIIGDKDDREWDLMQWRITKV